MSYETIAIIDIGSNSFRLSLFVKQDNGGIRRLDEVKKTVRLSEKMGTEKKITSQAINRALQSLHLFQEICRHYETRHVIAVATAAVRQASNQAEFLQLVEEETSLKLRVLSGEEEAYYDYLGVVNSFDLPNAYIIDVGGGSTEIIRMQDRQLTHSISIPLGAVTITETFIEEDPPSCKSLLTIQRYLRSILQSIPWLENKDRYPLIMLGGTARNLGKIHMRQEKPGAPIISNPRLLHNHTVPFEKMQRILQHLSSLPFEERQKVPGLSKGRADIIVGGISMIDELAAVLNVPEVTVSGCGLREGLLYEYLLPDGHPVLGHVLEHHARNLLLQYDPVPQQMVQAAEMSRQLFDKMATHHHLEPFWREILATATLLHRIGKYIDSYRQDEHTFYLVMRSPFYGLTLRNRILVALLTQQAYHKKWDAEKAARFETYLQKGDEEKIQQLGLYLRMAVQLCEEYGDSDPPFLELPLEVDQQAAHLNLPQPKRHACTIDKWKKEWEKFSNIPLIVTST